MIRILLLVILVASGLAVHLFFNERKRREKMAVIRWTFLAAWGKEPDSAHETRAFRVLEDPDLPRVRLPAAWTETRGPAGISLRDPASGRILDLRVTTLQRPVGVTPESLAEVLGGRFPEPERSVEVLPSGHALVKHVETLRDQRGDVVLYTWELGRPIPPDRARVVTFAFAVPAARAGDILTRDDLAFLEREIRAATFGD